MKKSLIFVILIAFSKILLADDVQQLWSQSNQQMDSKDWQKALAGYKQLLAMDIREGALYYNAGVAAFLSGDVASAMGYYLQAQEYIPRNANVQHNLNLIPAHTRYANQHWLENGLKKLTRLETVLASGFAWLLMWGLLASRHKLPKVVPALGVCLGILGVALSVWRLWFDAPVSVVKVQTPVHLAPHSKTEIILKTEDLIQTKVKEVQENWVRVEMPQTQEAWIERQNLIIVKAPKIF